MTFHMEALHLNNPDVYLLTLQITFQRGPQITHLAMAFQESPLSWRWRTSFQWTAECSAWSFPANANSSCVPQPWHPFVAAGWWASCPTTPSCLHQVGDQIHLSNFWVKIEDDLGSQVADVDFFIRVQTFWSFRTATCNSYPGISTQTPYGPCSGMGTNAFFTFTICLGRGLSYQAAFAAVFVAGCIFITLSITGLRTLMIRLFPEGVKESIWSCDKRTLKAMEGEILSGSSCWPPVLQWVVSAGWHPPRYWRWGRPVLVLHCIPELWRHRHATKTCHIPRQIRGPQRTDHESDPLNLENTGS